MVINLKENNIITIPVFGDFLRISFLQWLIGFIDAEGNFQIQKKKLKNGTIRIKCSFHIGLSLRDSKLLHEIKQFLNMGNIYEYEHRNEVHFAVSKKADLNKLVTMFDTYCFFTKNQADRYLIFRHCLKNIDQIYSNMDDFDFFIQKPINFIDYSSSNFNFFDPFFYTCEKKENIFKNWISGFITGEGCFHKNKSGKVFSFHLEQQEREVLDFMKLYFSFNPKIFIVKPRPGRKQTYALGISSKKDISKLISFLEQESPYFVSVKGYKKEQFISWKNDFNKNETK